jgi:flagellar basal body L-ring protein FlgH
LDKASSFAKEHGEICPITLKERESAVKSNMRESKKKSTKTNALEGHHRKLHQSRPFKKLKYVEYAEETVGDI